MYKLRIEKDVIKTLNKINEPFYTKIKTAILNLADNPRPAGYQNSSSHIRHLQSVICHLQSVISNPSSKIFHIPCPSFFLLKVSPPHSATIVL